MPVYCILILCSILIGAFIASYTDYILKREIKLWSGRRWFIIFLHMGIWGMILLTNGITPVSVLYLLAASAVLALAVVDLAIYEIPPQFNLWIAGMGVIQLVLDFDNWHRYLIGMVLVSGIFELIVILTKGNGMGGGDVKLMAAAGLLLGWEKIFLVMLLGSVLGAVIHSILMAVSKKEHVLAFGPYLSAAIIITMCYGEPMINWYIEKMISTTVG